jgi:hypothetical protein
MKIVREELYPKYSYPSAKARREARLERGARKKAQLAEKLDSNEMLIAAIRFYSGRLTPEWGSRRKSSLKQGSLSCAGRTPGVILRPMTWYLAQILVFPIPCGGTGEMLGVPYQPAKTHHGRN